jgi:hypothetical protein
VENITMKELFRVRDVSGKIVGPSFDDKMAAKRYRNELQAAGKATEESSWRFFVTAGKDHLSKQQIGKW